MSGSLLIALALAIPMATTGLIAALGRWPDRREAASLAGSVALALACLALLVRVGAGSVPELVVAEPLPGLEIAFRVDALGALFACVAGVLWPLNTLYSIGYMRALKESNQTRYYACFAIALFGAMGVAMAANLFTLFIFYEILTISTYPLVAHKGDQGARRGARIYLVTLIATSLGLLLPAIIVTAQIAGSTDFVAGGLLAGKASPAQAAWLLPAFLFGIGKAAMMPLHFWLPNAMVAPTPVSALLHAVAVVKAGVFALLKVSLFIFGPELLEQTPSRPALLWIALIGLVLASIIALRCGNLKARLAYSTVAQLAYVSVGALLVSGVAAQGAAMQILAHAFGKITLFMCAGIIYVATGFTEIRQMRGLGRKLPLVFIAFAVGSASVIGLPPFVGAWPKFLLMQGAWESGHPAAIAALALSSLLNLAYLLPIAVLGLMPPRSELVRAPEYLVVPSMSLTAVPIITAAVSLGLFFFIGPVAGFLDTPGIVGR